MIVGNAVIAVVKDAGGNLGLQLADGLHPLNALSILRAMCDQLLVNAIKSNLEGEKLVQPVSSLNGVHQQ